MQTEKNPFSEVAGKKEIITFSDFADECERVSKEKEDEEKKEIKEEGDYWL